MKIHYSYREYPYSDAASGWSRLAGKLSGFSFFIALGFVILAEKILDNFFSNKNGVVIASIIIGIVLTSLIIAFCHRMEKKCAQRDLPKASASGGLTDEQVRMLVEAYQKQKSSGSR